jgi:hypothetical protein
MAEALRREEVFVSEANALEHLPTADTRHWVPRHKAAVVGAVRSGALSLKDVRERYMLTDEELQSWMDAIDQHGIAGLRANMRDRRNSPRQPISEPAGATLHVGARVDCLITDVSDQGARLQFGTTVSLPSIFEVHCEKSGRSWWVNPVWQRGRTAGVRFSNPLAPPWTIKTGLGAWLIGKRRTVCIDRVDTP